jgi:O-antigen ligase
MDYRPDLLILVLAAFLFFDIGRLQKMYGFIAVFRPALLLSAASLALLFATRDLGRLQVRLKDPLILLILGLLAWATFGIPAALTAGRSFAFLTGTFVKTVIMTVVILLAIRNERDAEFLLGAMFAAIAVYGIVTVQRFEVGVGERYGELYTYDANDLAQVIVSVAPIGIFLLRSYTQKLLKAFCWVSLGVLLVLMVKSGSRGGFLGLMAALGYMLFTSKTISPGKRLGIVVVAFAALGILGSQSGYWDFIGTLGNLDEDYNMNSHTGRMAIWSRGLGYLLANPIFGVGIDGFMSAEGHLSGMQSVLGPDVGFKWSAAHNSWVQVGVELGFPGLIMFSAMWIGLILRARKLSVDPLVSARVRALGTAVTIGLSGFVVTAFFLSQGYSSMLYTFVAIVAALDMVAIRGPAVAPRMRRVRPQGVPAGSPAGAGAPAPSLPGASAPGLGPPAHSPSAPRPRPPALPPLPPGPRPNGRSDGAPGSGPPLVVRHPRSRSYR